MLIVLFHKTPLCIDFWGEESRCAVAEKAFLSHAPAAFLFTPEASFVFFFFLNTEENVKDSTHAKKQKFLLFAYLLKTATRSHVTIVLACDFLPAVPQYRAPFLVDSNSSTVCVNWSGSFFLNGPLKEFVLMDGGQRVYSGLDTTLYLPRTADKSEFLAPVPQRGWRSAPRLYETGGPKGDHQRLVLKKRLGFKWPLPAAKLPLRGNKVFFPSCRSTHRCDDDALGAGSG